MSAKNKPLDGAAEESKAVIPAPETAVGAPLIDFSADAGAGLEEVRPEDKSIPFLAILANGSPQTDRGHAKHINGAIAGMVFNTVTEELFDVEREDTSIDVIPCGFKKVYALWNPRSNGGGLVGMRDIDDPEVKKWLESGRTNEQGKPVSPDGCDIVETAYHQVLLVTPDVAIPAVISMKSTALKVSRRWLTVMSNKTAVGRDSIPFPLPSFSHSYKLGTVRESNPKGSWYNWQLRDSGTMLTDPTLYHAAKAFAKEIRDGAVKFAADPDATGGHDAGADNDGDDTPF